jgi:thiol:disulfide interchange protein
MKTTLATMLFSIIGTASTVWAAVDGLEDHSGLLCWIFLGFCALIVVAQLLPAIMMMAGMAKGVAEHSAKAEEKAAK